MTPENRRFNLQQEWRASNEELEVGLKMEELGYHRQAVGRYYYSCFHAVRAVLLSRGQEPATHTGLVTEFHRLFVHSGLLEPHRARALTRLQRDREQADYTPVVSFSQVDCEQARASVEDLRGFVDSLLRQEGWL